MVNTCTYLPLSGKVALVTGGGRGIGAGIALELARRGASVAINYGHSAKSAQEVVEAIQAIGRQAVAIQADLTCVPNIESLIQEVVRHFGRLDIVVSNSGMEKFKPLEETTLAASMR